MKRIMLVLLLAIAAAVLVIVGWVSLYPKPQDPKNITYVLWKHGLCKMDLDLATGIMIGDSADGLVVGKTEAEIRQRFGFLVPPSQATEYLRWRLKNSPWKNRRVLFIRNSPLMVVFDGDRAVDLVLVKG